MHIVEIGKGVEALAVKLRDLILPENVSIYLLGLAAEEQSAFECWVGEYTRRLTMELKREYEMPGDEQRKCLIIVLTENMEDPFTKAAADGCWESLRGIVHVLTLEKRANHLILNLIRGGKEDMKSIVDAVVFLSEEHTDFCAGCTFDVRDWK